MIKLVSGFLLILTHQVWAADLNCQSGTDQRKLALTDVDGGCKLEYTKAGETKELATQKKGHDYCEKVQAKIKSTLESSNFKCSE